MLKYDFLYVLDKLTKQQHMFIAQLPRCPQSLAVARYSHEMSPYLNIYILTKRRAMREHGFKLKKQNINRKFIKPSFSDGIFYQNLNPCVRYLQLP